MRRLLALFMAALLLPVAGCTAPQPAPPSGPLPSSPPEVPPAPGPSASPESPSEPEPSPEPEISLPLEPSPQAPPPEPRDSDFVRVLDYIPDIRVSLPYATRDNFTGQIIYEFEDAWLRYGTVKKLSAAAQALTEEGYALLIWDAFRPAQAQFKLWEVCPDPSFVADPTKGFSSHSRGNTVDVTLALPDGGAVEMPSGFDEFSSLANRDYSDVPEPAAAHAKLLEDVMESCGFHGYSGEWWHFRDEEVYPVEEAFTPPGRPAAAPALSRAKPGPRGQSFGLRPNDCPPQISTPLPRL